MNEVDEVNEVIKVDEANGTVKVIETNSDYNNAMRHSSTKCECKESTDTTFGELVKPYYVGLNPINVFGHNTVYSDNVFTINADDLMQTYKVWGNPLHDIIEYKDRMNSNIAYNITRFVPNIGRVILLGIGSISPLVLSGVIKSNNSDIKDYITVMEFFVVGVAHVEKNYMFGMKAIYTLNKETTPLSQLLDPLSEYNLSKSYSGLKNDMTQVKDKITRVATRLLFSVDESEIKAFTF